jgi:O-antigen ligase
MPVFSVALAAAAVLLAVAMGLALAVDVRLGAALAFGALTVPLALVDLPAVIALAVALTVFSRDPAFGLVATAAGLLVLAGWLAYAHEHRTAVRSALRLHRHLVALVVLLLVWLTLSLAWSQDSSAALSELVYWYVNAAAIVVLLTSVRTLRDVRLVISALVLAVVTAVCLALAGVDLTAPSALDAGATAEGRLQGVIGDPNFTAAFIVAAVVLSATLGAIAAPRTRGLLVPAVVVLVVGLAATMSRGGILAALAAFATAVALVRGRRAAVLGAGAVVLLVAALWFSANPAAVERIRAADEDRGSGREDIWLVARRLSAEHPIGGVGLANFRPRSREYVRRPGTLEYVELIVDRPHEVHNTYLQMLAETGAVGLALFLAIVATAVTSAVRAARAFEQAGERALARVSGGVAAAAVGLLTAAFFISLQATSTFWVVLMLGPVLLGVSRRTETEARRRTVAQHPPGASFVPVPRTVPSHGRR